MRIAMTSAIRGQRSIVHAVRATQPALVLARTLATGRSSSSANAASSSSRESSSAESPGGRKARSSSRTNVGRLNLLSPVGSSSGDVDVASSASQHTTVTSSNSNNGKFSNHRNKSSNNNSSSPQEWRHRPNLYNTHRPNNDPSWWKQMDRASFRKLLDECMAVGNVSSVLRKYMDEFPILDNTWSDQELVLITGALIKMNRSETALAVLRNQIDEPNRNRLNRVAAESARLGNAQVALGILDIAKHFSMAPDVITYTSAIHACARGNRGDVPVALQLLNEMIQDGVAPNHRTYGAAVLAYARMNRWDDIEALMDAIPYVDDKHKSDVFAASIITCARNRQYMFATRLFTLLLEQGIYPGDSVCNAALSACARTADVHRLTVIFRLVEKHATPTIYTFNSMISAHGNARKLDAALDVFTIMQQRGVAPDAVTFNALLLAAVRSRAIDRVPHILELMDAAGAKWDVYTLNMLLEACVVTADAAQAETYWAIATGKSTLKQNVRLDRTHFETLLGVYSTAKQFDNVLALWRDQYVCRRRAKSAKTLNYLLQACTALRDDASALSLLDEFTARGHVASSASHNHLLACLLAANKVDDALAHLTVMERDGLATTFSYTLLMKHRLGKTTAALERDANSKSVKSAKGNDAGAHDALALFTRYIDTRDRHARWSTPLLHFPTDALYVLAARAAERVGAHDDLVAIYTESPVTMSLAVKSAIASSVLTSCERESDWKTAVLVYDELVPVLDDATNVAFYEQVVKIVARAGEFEKALDVNGGDWYRLNRTDKGWGF